ncbi:cytoplasmic protein [Rathayibacter sp. YIM 133350]|uniref:cytoplasmic protein n=1 Tax=Rathayibacter sp. YIM 133350 TaxID=3131992 RepID=UPI00307F7648
MIHEDPVVINPEHYSVLWENELVRVLRYSDLPGEATTFHVHPDSVMVTLSDFQRRLFVGDREANVALDAGQAVWLPAQRHAGENTGETPTHTILIELKHSDSVPDEAALGPSAP